MRKLIFIYFISLLSFNSAFVFALEEAELLYEEVNLNVSIRLSSDDAIKIGDKDGVEQIGKAYFRKSNGKNRNAIVLVGKSTNSKYIFNIDQEKTEAELVDSYQRFIKLTQDRNYTLKLNSKNNKSTSNGFPDSLPIITQGYADVTEEKLTEIRGYVSTGQKVTATGAIHSRDVTVVQRDILELNYDMSQLVFNSSEKVGVLTKYKERNVFEILKDEKLDKELKERINSVAALRANEFTRILMRCQ